MLIKIVGIQKHTSLYYNQCIHQNSKSLKLEYYIIQISIIMQYDNILINIGNIFLCCSLRYMT